MKKSMLLAMCLTVSALANWGGVNSAFASNASMSVAAVQNVEDDGNKDDVTAGDETNKATFSWSGTTLTVTGKGDLSKITVTDENTKVFSATGAGKVYTKSGETATAVKQGDAYDSETQYYEAEVTYGDAMTPTATWSGDYTMTTNLQFFLNDNQSIHACYWDIANGELTTMYVTVAASKAEEAKNQNWDGKETTHNKYYYFCLVEGALPASESDKITFSMSNAKDGVLTGEGYKITLFSADNRSTYAHYVSTITSKKDNLYSKDQNATEYVYHANGTTWEYTDGQLLYLGTSTAKNDAIADNEEYFGTTHVNYIESAVLSFVEYLPYAVQALGCSETHDATVIFKTIDGVQAKDDFTTKVNLTNEITRALVSIDDIQTLNLQDTYLASINANDPTDWDHNYNDPTFVRGKLGDYNPAVNKYLKTLYLPCTGSKVFKRTYANGGSNIYTVFQYMVGLKNLYMGEGIETIDEYSFVIGTSKDEYENQFKLSSISFPNTLKTIKTHAFDGQTGILTFTFPAGMELIEKAAFESTNPRDVYFLGLEAPKVEKDAWGDNSYISNNSLKFSTVTYENSKGEVGGIQVDLSTGLATRLTYLTQNGYMTMLHYPTKCSKMQAAKYTDLTRTYKKIVYGTTTDPDIKAKKYENGDVEYYYYAPGKEESPIKGSTSSTSSSAAGGTEAEPFTNLYPAGTYGGNYAGGYDDVFVGSQYNWPSMVMAYRATVVAQHGLLWDGVTTIKDGINNVKADVEEEYTGDGSEFIGLHQFVFAQGDVTTDNTNEWDVTKYADGKWHSLCLPFDITKAKLEETFGPDKDGNYNYRVCKFSQVDRNEQKLKLYFNDEQYQNAESESSVVIEGHVSYMVKLQKEGFVEGDKVILKNYVMKEGSAEPTNVKVNDQIESNDNTKAASQYYFIGQYLADVKIPQYSYFFSKTTNGFRFQTGTTGKWNAYSSVVEAPNGAEDNERYFSDNDSQAKLSTIWDEDETTGIDKVTIEADGEIVYTNDNVYNLNGQLVSTRGLNGLSKGIYIQNGKKYIVR